MKRAIVRVVIRSEEKASLSSTSFSWSSTDIHTITAECGHVRVHRGSGAPKKSIVCKACAKGLPPVPVTGPLGVIDQTRRTPKHPLAAALVPP